MKRTKFFAGALALVFAMSLGLASCSNDDDDNNNTSNTSATTKSEAEQELEDAAFNILRSLCTLPTEDESDENNGVEELSEGWQGMEFMCDEGYVLDEDSEAVRSVAVTDLDEARVYVSSLVGEELDSDTTSGYWNFSGLGSFRFKTSGEEGIFATLDVSIPIIANLSQIQFVSADYLKENLSSAENSYSGLPYYAAGDVVRRKKDGTYWMCVRPAGGDLRKDKSYWMCLHPFDKSGKCIIKSEKKTYSLAYDITKTMVVEGDWEWVYAKNLMTLKTAKAAGHTLLVLACTDTYSLYPNAETAFTELKNSGYNVMALERSASSSTGDHQVASNEFGYMFAYDSPKKDSNRAKKRTSRELRALPEVSDEYKKYVTTLGMVSYVQPILGAHLALSGENGAETMMTKRIAETLSYSSFQNVEFLLSTTDAFDESYMFSQKDTQRPFPSNGTDEEMLAFTYDFSNFLHYVDEVGGLQYKDYVDTESHSYSRWMSPLPGWHVLYSPELVIKDNKGTATTQKKPDSAFEDIYRQDGTATDGTGTHFDWWASLAKTVRTIDNKAVDWNTENK